MKTLGKFEVVEKIGQGAMGVVYKARDPFIGRLVALKTITVGLAEDPALLERFYQEARSAGALQHPNIVTIYELGREGDTPFIAMEFLEGGSLDKVIESRVQLSVAQKLGYIVHVCRALEYAHARGVVHRDIKPGNVMVTSEGAVKVVDFGIARLVGSGRTQTGLLIGTLGYMSPQLIRGKHADARSDIWAVGIMLFEMLANRRPFHGENHADLMMNILTQATPPIPGLGEGVPAELEPVIGKMLQKDADTRYQSMQEVLIALDPIWDQLQKEEVSLLIENGQQLLQAGELDQAQEMARRAILSDTGNVHAKSLAERISAEIRRQQIVPQVKARVQKAEGFLSNKQFEEAKAEVEAALQLDSTFHPARELLAQVQAASERERELALALRTSKQRLIEGDLVEAELLLAKAFEMEPASLEAREVERQIREEKARRERQKKLAEIKHRARTFWSELRYQECIDLLLQAREEFPSDFEITKLLETAQQDKAEHEKQTLLAEARGLVGAQRFDDALQVLENVLKIAPADPTASNLRNLALQGREQQILEQQLRKDIENLRALVKDAKYQDAISRGEELLKEFPREFEIGELITYAKNEQAQVERKIRRDQWLEKINRAIAAERYPEAIQAAEAAMGEFARDIDVKILLEKAKQRQEQKERAEQLERRIRDVRSKINREELTDAIALARETIVTLGPNTDIRQLLNQAEVEYGQREKKRASQHDAIQAAQTLVDRGNFAEATRKIEDALATRLFTPTDPQVTALLRDIDVKKTPPPPPAAPPAAAPKPPASAPAPASWTAPSKDPAKDYVYQQGMRLPEAPPAPPQDGSASMIFSATSVAGPSVQPVLPPPPAAPEIQEPSKGKKKKRDVKEEKPQKDFEATRIEQGATQIGHSAPVMDQGATMIASPATEIAPPPAKKIAPPAAPSAAPAAPPVAPVKQPAQRAPAPPPAVRAPVETVPAAMPLPSQPIWKQPVGLIGIAVLVLAIGGGAAYYFHSNSSPKPEVAESQAPASAQPAAPAVSSEAPKVAPVLPPQPPPVDPLAKQQDDLIKQATKLAGSNDYDAAIAKLNDADNVHGPRSADIAKLRNSYTEDKTNVGLAKLRQQEQGLWDTANGDFGRNDLDQAQSAFQQIVGLPDGGVYKKDAQDFLSNRIPNRRDAERLFDSANQESRQARDDQAWRQVAGNLQQALTKGLSDQHSADARALLATANTNAEQFAADRDAFSKLQVQFNDPATQKNKQALETLLDEFKRLAGANGPYKQQSSDYVGKIEPMLAALNAPAPLPPAPPTPTPPVKQDESENARMEIGKVFMDLSQAFGSKNLSMIHQLWPSIPAKQSDTLKTSFGAVKSFSRNFNPTTITVNGDTASASGTYSGIYSAGNQNTPSNGPFQATLKNQGGHWIIVNLMM